MRAPPETLGEQITHTQGLVSQAIGAAAQGSSTDVTRVHPRAPTDTGDHAAAAQLVPGDLGAQHVQRAEVAQLLVARRLVLDLHRRQDEAGQVDLEAGVGAADRHAQLLEHLVAVDGTDHGRQTRVLQRLADLGGVVGQSGRDLHTRAGEHAVDGVGDGVGVVTQAGGVRRLHHARRQRHATPTHAGDRRHEHGRVGTLLHPGLLPALQLVVEVHDGRPERLVDAREQLLLALVGDEAAIQPIDGLEDLGVAATHQLLAQLEERRVDLLVVAVGEGLHGTGELAGHIEETHALGQRRADGTDDGRLVDLQHATRLEHLEPRAVVGHTRQNAVERHSAHGRGVDRGNRGLQAGQELTHLDHLHAHTHEIGLGEG